MRMAPAARPMPILACWAFSVLMPRMPKTMPATAASRPIGQAQQLTRGTKLRQLERRAAPPQIMEVVAAHSMPPLGVEVEESVVDAGVSVEVGVGVGVGGFGLDVGSV